MQHYYDGLEIRPSPLREQQQLEQLNHLLTHVGQYCAGYSSAYRQRRLQELGELATLPLLDATDLFAAQQAHPPFAGLTGRPASQALRVFACPGQLAIPEYAGADWWGAARALFAAGFKAGEVLLNGHDYHAGPTAFIFDNGARQLGAPVVPCGPHDTQRQLEALLRYQPTSYVGPLVTLLDLLEAAEAAEIPSDSLRRALLCEATHPETAPLRAIHGIAALNCLVWQDVGVVAYESQPGLGFIVNVELHRRDSRSGQRRTGERRRNRPTGGDKARSGVSPAAAGHRLAGPLARQTQRMRAHQPVPQAGVATHSDADMHRCKNANGQPSGCPSCLWRGDYLKRVSVSPARWRWRAGSRG
ncbi:phenylacetate--CoA ligase [Aeromonas salmonicida]|uniref:Anaerobic phenylacetate CoA ligase n=2 Tax=Aeromonas salmonicida subsp. salmonicida TaxID=29491 RepID=A4SKD8_AERS4|nr:hypothetical protein [Aeromonas salmonicida]ABO89360.1 anaerobic phenylacetate CoA ligase [Aeromonas salmonicida subsp. salmonicida A449]EHI51825.1 anaerobic phenylacetate CoA ligase [Aeromonas salmonicida subsp. salmonicida 01-B526]KHE98199.1 phenylacetate--CoA ligase [Aeromonas salmonicida subsp. salmonicida]MCK3679000.1 phenylacetate--CoA ligase [Aeromonas salmonicida subsp. salmonicida]MCR4453935.1 phenylacetate--CoA ligase [Aeromonas salmonicida]